MNHPLTRVLLAVLAFGAAVALSVWLFRGSGIGLFIDGALFIVFIYYLTTLAGDKKGG